MNELLARIAALDARVKAATAPIAAIVAEHTAFVQGTAVPPAVQNQVDAALTTLATDVETMVAPLGLPAAG